MSSTRTCGWGGDRRWGMQGVMPKEMEALVDLAQRFVKSSVLEACAIDDGLQLPHNLKKQITTLLLLPPLLLLLPPPPPLLLLPLP